MKNFKTKKEYINKLIPIIEKINPNLKGNIFKFKMTYSTDIPQCAWSLMRMNQTGDEQSNNEILSEECTEEEDDLSEESEYEILEEESFEKSQDNQKITNLGKKETYQKKI